MQSPVIAYSVRLEAWVRGDGAEWLVWCPAIDVMTQARRKKQALESLREAVELWFESCIERGVLDSALTEVGFTKVPPNEEARESVNFVSAVRHPASQPATRKGISFSLGQRKGSDYIEGTIPAYIAATQLGDAARARG